MRRLFALMLASLLVSCVTYREELNRAQRQYEANEYERALAIFRVLEADMNSLSLNDQARYAYLRGMTDYRLAYREDARHWLGLAQAIEEQSPGGLSDIWKGRIEEALTDLNRDVFGGAETFDADAGASEEAPPEKPAEPAGAPCSISPDCPPDHMCQDSICVPL